MGFGSWVNVGEAGIDAAGWNLEAGTPNWSKKSSSVELR